MNYNFGKLFCEHHCYGLVWTRGYWLPVINSNMMRENDREYDERNCYQLQRIHVNNLVKRSSNFELLMFHIKWTKAPTCSPIHNNARIEKTVLAGSNETLNMTWKLSHPRVSQTVLYFQFLYSFHFLSLTYPILRIRWSFYFVYYTRVQNVFFFSHIFFQHTHPCEYTSVGLTQSASLY